MLYLLILFVILQTRRNIGSLNLFVMFKNLEKQWRYNENNVCKETGYYYFFSTIY